MAKKKNKRRKQSNLLPIAAVAIGIYLLLKDRARVLEPVKQQPTAQQYQTAIEAL